MVSENNDYLLVQDCLAGEQDAFEALLAKYRNQIFSLILRLVQNQEDAEDVAQQTFIKAFKNLAAYDPQYPFITWLFKIAHNSSIDFLRAKKPASVSIDDEDAPLEIEDNSSSMQAQVSYSFSQTEAEKLLGGLPTLYREVLLLQYREELSCKEIADVLGIPEGTVKVRLFRARTEMRKKLETFEKAGKL